MASASASSPLTVSFSISLDLTGWKNVVIGRVVAIIVAIIFDQLRKQRRPRVSQSVNTGRRWRGKYCFASRGEQIIVENCHARFIKKISQLKSDIRSCRCKNFSLKVVSVRSDRGGPDPPDPPPGSVTAKLEENMALQIFQHQPYLVLYFFSFSRGVPCH